MKKIVILLLALNLNTAIAAEVGYEVEVVIFEDITGKYATSENWIDMVQRIPGQEYIQQQPTEEEITKRSTEYKVDIAPGENQLLKEHVAKLISHPEFKVHVHKVWKQPGLDKDMAVPFEINSQEQMLDPAQYLSQQELTAQSEAIDTELTEYSSYVEGSVTLIMSRYLHFNTDLVLHRTIGETIESYPVKGERRMRSRETHYIDHPLLGVIVIATPFKILTDEDKRKPIGTYRTL